MDHEEVKRALQPLMSTVDNAGNGSMMRKSKKSAPVGQKKCINRGRWSKEEDEKLNRLICEHGNNWSSISYHFPDRSDMQCQQRWEKVVNPELKKGPWTREEDTKLIHLVAKYGPKKWTFIARNLPGRIGKQCRERYHNHLNPNINKSAWTDQEENVIINAHKLYGNSWAKIAKLLQGRTDNAIKNHWNSTLKRRAKSREIEKENGSPNVNVATSGNLVASATVVSGSGGEMNGENVMSVPMANGEMQPMNHEIGGNMATMQHMHPNNLAIHNSTMMSVQHQQQQQQQQQLMMQQQQMLHNQMDLNDGDLQDLQDVSDLLSPIGGLYDLEIDFSITNSSPLRHSVAQIEMQGQTPIKNESDVWLSVSTPNDPNYTAIKDMNNPQHSAHRIVRRLIDDSGFQSDTFNMLGTPSKSLTHTYDTQMNLFSPSQILVDPLAESTTVQVKTEVMSPEPPSHSHMLISHHGTSGSSSSQLELPQFGSSPVQMELTELARMWIKTSLH